MQLVTIAALAASLAVAKSEPVRVIPPAAVAKDGKACPPLFRHTFREAVSPRGRLLIDAPPAYLHYAVDRRENGCPVPALVGGARQR